MTTSVRFIRRGALRPRSVRIGLGAVVAAVGLVLAGAIPAGAVPAAGSATGSEHGVKAGPIEEQVLHSFINKTTSSTGVKLDLSFDALRLRNLGDLDTAQVILSPTRDTEEHTWTFPIGASALTTRSSGAGSLKTGSAEGPYGSMSITFTPTASKRIYVCNASNYQLQQAERVKGRFLFDTRSTGRHAWGKVGSASRSFSFNGTTELFTYHGIPCPNLVAACSNEVSWSAGTGLIGFIGSAGDGPSGIEASREVLLSTPKGSRRVDLVFGKAPAPVLSTKGRDSREKVTTAAGGAFSGSGTVMSSKSPMVTKSRCKTGTLTMTDWDAATFIAGPSTLRAREQIFGTITMPKAKITATMERIKR